MKKTTEILDKNRIIDYICSMISLIFCGKNNRAYARLHVLDYVHKATHVKRMGGLFLCGVVTILSTGGQTIQTPKTDENCSLSRIPQREQAMSHLRQPETRHAINLVQTLCTQIGLSWVIGYGLY